MRYLLCLLTLLLVACDPAQEVSTEEASPPNILFILTDDQGIGDLSLHGNDSIATPNLDALLRGSARFSRFYVSPVCAPTRASFLSGQYHPRTGAVFVTRRRETMSDSIRTIAEVLRDAGYRTGLFGKWHNGATFPYHPAGQGFEEFLGFTLGHFNDYFNGELKNERDEAVPFSGDLTQILSDSATHFMTNATAPFFCMLTYQAPHTPVQVADAYWERKAGLSPYNRGIYAMIESIDDRVGQVLASLEAAGKLENTIVIFSTDNGPNGDRYRMGLKGTKGSVDEGGVRAPFGMRLPGDHPANGRVWSTPAAHIDLLPTLCDLLGLEPPEGLDGVSLMPLLEEDTIAHRYIYALKQGYDYTGYPGSMRDSQYLLIANTPEDFELYDLLADPGQRSDLGGAAGNDRRQELRTVLEGLRATYQNFAPSLARPDRIAPPIDLDAAPAAVRLLAHEGEPRGSTTFSQPNGWANDYFVQLGTAGAVWPIHTEKTERYRGTILYHLDAPTDQLLSIETDQGDELMLTLPVAKTRQLPVADRVRRKEVYPRDWAELKFSDLKISAGATVLQLSASPSTDLWIKEVALTAE